MQMFFKTGVVRNFAIFTRKLYRLQLYFNLVPKETSTIFKNSFFIEQLRWLLLSV